MTLLPYEQPDSPPELHSQTTDEDLAYSLAKQAQLDSEEFKDDL